MPLPVQFGMHTGRWKIHGVTFVYAVSQLRFRARVIKFERSRAVFVMFSTFSSRATLSILLPPRRFFSTKEEKKLLSLSLSWLVTLTEDRTRIDTNDSQVHVEFDIYCVA